MVNLKLIISAGMLLAGSAVHAAEAGRLVFVTGQVQLGAHTALLDASVQEGDELQTGADGYVYVKTVDQGFLILRPNSRARIATYHVDVDHPANTRVKLELLSGVARSISGQAVKRARQNFRFNTPVAAIGVRGTDFIVYTDQRTSRVAVVSGGVIVSGFAATCGPEGSGPCEGAASRELFAGQAGALLQVERGQREPKLLHNPSLLPDQNAAPRPDEPVGKVAAAPALAAPEVNLDPKKGYIADAGHAGSGGLRPVVPSDGGTTGTVPPELVVSPGSGATGGATPPAEGGKQVSEVFWGRWQPLAAQHADAALVAKVGANKALPPVYVGPYVMGRQDNTSFVMPKQGTAAFVFDSGEALIQRGGKADVAATIENAHLSVDFGAQSFATSLDVVGGGVRVPVNGTGAVSRQGALESSAMSESIVRGFLGGAKADEAGYLFKNTATPGMTVVGATKWGR